MNEFEKRVVTHNNGALYSQDLEIVQVNIGLRCNQHCTHCHLGSSPSRTEMMEWETMEQVIEVARKTRPDLLDVTGGAPELHPNFREFVGILRDEGFPVQVRTNLTPCLEPEYKDIPAFLGDLGVFLIASLPCYLEENVDSQRGNGTYQKSIRVLKDLNSIGYGIKEDLPLNLVYNPTGPSLPPSQLQLEADYKRELEERFGIRFNRLITITNMPLGRFLGTLKRDGTDEQYRELLRDAFNPAALEGLMCRHQISIGWDGRIYDCDFNLALDLPVNGENTGHVREFDPELLIGRRITTGTHCFGCTAGYGSSCGGALVF